MKKKIFLVSSIFLWIDIVSKQLVKNFLPLEESISLLPNFFRLTFVYNDGAAFSILRGKQVFLIGLALFLLGIIIYYIKKENLNWYKTFYYSLLISGVIGNLIDRIFYPGVIDFLDFTLFGYEAPIFNLADTFIVVGVFLIIIEMIRKDVYERVCRRR